MCVWGGSRGTLTCLTTHPHPHLALAPGGSGGYWWQRLEKLPCLPSCTRKPFPEGQDLTPLKALQRKGPVLQGVDVVVTRGLAHKLASRPHTAVELDVGTPQAAVSWNGALGSTPTRVPILLAHLPSVTTRGGPAPHIPKSSMGPPDPKEQAVESTRFRAA